MKQEAYESAKIEGEAQRARDEIEANRIKAYNREVALLKSKKTRIVTNKQSHKKIPKKIDNLMLMIF